MVPNLNELRLAEERRRELLREAALLRQDAEIAAIIQAARLRRRPFYGGALARLGRLLAAWGAQLQAIDAQR